MRNTNRYYAGVGSRKTPQNIQIIMTEIATKMGEMGFILRSGGADGADKAFAKGAFKKDIFYASDATPASMRIAAGFHPAWDGMKMFSRRLHGRNTFQVFGKEMEIPSELLICWTSDACIAHEDRTRSTGGTGTSISIASFFKVPVFNLKREEHLRRITSWLK